MKRLMLIAALAGAAGSPPAFAQNFASLDMIDRQVEAFLRADTDARGSTFTPVDRRLRLSSCPLPTALDWYGARRDTVLVRCPVPDGWKLFIPVTGGGAAAARVVARGDTVTVTVRGPGFGVARTGQAQENGASGEWIRVRIDRTEELRAQVLAPGSVGINLP